MDAESVVRKILDDNRKSREQASRRISRLTDVIQNGTVDEYQQAIDDILKSTYEDDQGSGDDVLGQNGQAESADGRDRNVEPQA